MHDATQLRILKENRQRLEDTVVETQEALELLVRLNEAASVATHLFVAAPYFSGLVVTMLSDIADCVRKGEHIDKGVADNICRELIHLRVGRAVTKEVESLRESNK